MREQQDQPWQGLKIAHPGSRSHSADGSSDKSSFELSTGTGLYCPGQSPLDKGKRRPSCCRFLFEDQAGQQSCRKHHPSPATTPSTIQNYSRSCYSTRNAEGRRNQVAKRVSFLLNTHGRHRVVGNGDKNSAHKVGCRESARSGPAPALMVPSYRKPVESSQLRYLRFRLRSSYPFAPLNLRS